MLHILDVKLAKKPSQAAQKQGKLNVYMEAMKGMQNLYDGVDDVWAFVRTAVDYATIEDHDTGQCLPNDIDIHFDTAVPSKSSACIKAVNDWGNVLVQEPVLYFRLSRTIDLSLAFGRYSEDSSLCLSPRSVRFPSPRIVFIDVGVQYQGVEPRIGKTTNKGSAYENQVSEAIVDQFSSEAQLLDETDDFFAYDIGLVDLQTPASIHEFELAMEGVEANVL